MKKAGVFVVLVLLISLFLVSSVIAPTNSTNSSTTTTTTTTSTTSTSTATADVKVQKAYDCLRNKVTAKNKCADLTVEEQAFSLLALKYDADSQRNCKLALKNSGKENLCWPSSGCRIRDTALAVLALKMSNSDTKLAEDYLILKNGTPTDLIWYLQIDTVEQARCKIIYDGNEKTITVGSDKKLSSDAGGCLTRNSDGFWLQISSSCYDKKFIVECDKQFVTNLLYKRQNSQTIFVSSKTSQASANAQTEETVNVKCLKDGNTCDYEGTLWAALALYKSGRDISVLMPYITATAGDNEKYFPSSILYVMTREDLYDMDIRGKQISNTWQITNSPYSKQYDSALAIMALLDSKSQAVSDSQSYFLSLQANDGCLTSSIRDNAFLLFAGWPRQAVPVPDNYDCLQSADFCVAPQDCLSANGKLLGDNYYCRDIGMKCCDKQPPLKSCSELGGRTCASGETCSISTVSSSDSSPCCKGTCEKAQTYTCSSCRSVCGDDETELQAGLTCPQPEVCCGPKPSQSSLWIWILLIIIIILAILAFLFRDKLKEFWFMFKARFSKPSPPSPPSPGMRTAPRGFPPRPGMMPMSPQRFQPRPMPPQQRTTEFDDTLKKLKDMSQ